MNKDSVLTHILKSKGMPTLLGGEMPASVINNSKYISLLTYEAPAWGKNEEDNFPSLDQAILTAVAGEDINVILEGPEGSGKTTALVKLIVDWAKGEHLQNFAYVFHFRFRELNFLDGTLSLETLMLQHHGHIPPESMSLILQKPEDVLLVFDEMDQCKESLDSSIHTLCSDPSQATSLPSLMASLLHGSLLKGASFLVATRPTVILKFVSGTCVEVLGFLKPQREAYVNGFFTDPAAASKALVHMERTLGFYDICTSPRFCWTVCSVYKSLMDAGAKLPEKLSQLYVDIVIQLIQTLSLDETCNRELVLALGKMAAHCFLEEHPSCTKDEIYSFGFRQFPSVAVFLRVYGDQSDRCVFSFHSQMMQEFLLALSFFLDKSTPEGAEKIFEKYKNYPKFMYAFMSALSEPSQYKPLETLVGELTSDRITDFKSWFKSSPEMTLKSYYKDQLHHCLHMLHQAQNESLVKEIITHSPRTSMRYGALNLQDCVALDYVVTCLGEIEELNLRGNIILTEEQAEVLAKTMSLSPVVCLRDTTLTTRAVPHLASALSRGVTRDLDLSHNYLGDDNFKILSNGLRVCKLQCLNLQRCRLTEASCEDLVSVLTSDTTQLCVLEMSSNRFGDQGLMTLCKALHSPHCKLQYLQLQFCQLTAASMEALSAALCSGQSQLRKVNLTENTIGHPGVEALCKALQHPLCKLQSLNVFNNEVTGECCPHLMEVLMSEHFSLSELDLSVNELGQEGALLLCRGLSQPGCPLIKLGLARCELTESVFKELGSVLSSGTSQLKALTVGVNDVGDPGVKHLWDAVAHPNCMLEELDVEMTGLTDASVQDLCAAIRASKTLKSLKLRNNLLTDASVPALVQVMQDSENMLEMSLRYNQFSEDGFGLILDCDKITY